MLEDCLWCLFLLVSFVVGGELTYHNKVNDPIRRRPHRRAPRPHRRTINLRRIQPRDTLEAESEKRIIQEKERHSGLRNLCLTRLGIPNLLRVANQDCEHEVAETLACCSQHHHFPTAPALDEGDGERAEDEVGDGVAGGEEASEVVGEADGGLEDGGEVVGRYVDAGELLRFVGVSS